MRRSILHKKHRGLANANSLSVLKVFSLFVVKSGIPATLVPHKEHSSESFGVSILESGDHEVQKCRVFEQNGRKGGLDTDDADQATCPPVKCAELSGRYLVLGTCRDWGVAVKKQLHRRFELLNHIKIFCRVRVNSIHGSQKPGCLPD